MGEREDSSVAVEQLSRSRKRLISIGVGTVFLTWGLMCSVLPPIYPREAEDRGATSSQYGLVFGISHLSAFFFSPFFADCGESVGPKRMYRVAYLAESMAGGITFSLLAYVQSPVWFITLSLVLRFVYGAAESAAAGALLGMLTKMFPDKASTVMSLTEAFYGLGFLIGPAVGAWLYNLGHGLFFPLLTVGILSFASGTLTYCAIPTSMESSGDCKDKATSDLRTVKLLKIPAVMFALLDNTLVMFSNGYIDTNLEPHARVAAGMSMNQIGFAFLTGGTIYMVASPAIGYMSDRWSRPSQLAVISLVGNLIMACSDITAGPASVLSSYVHPSLGQIFVVCALDGFGQTFVVVSTYARISGALEDAGYEMDTNSCLIISGAHGSSFFLGSFLGATVSGALVEYMGFARTGLAFALLHVAMAALNLAIGLHFCSSKKSAYSQVQECQMSLTETEESSHDKVLNN